MALSLLAGKVEVFNIFQRDHHQDVTILGPGKATKEVEIGQSQLIRLWTCNIPASPHSLTLVEASVESLPLSKEFVFTDGSPNVS